MALRIRKSGQIVCAAEYGEELGDCYIDDPMHYRLAVELKVIHPINPEGTVWEFWEAREWQ